MQHLHGVSVSPVPAVVISLPPPATMVQILPFGFKMDNFNDAPAAQECLTLRSLMSSLQVQYVTCKYVCWQCMVARAVQSVQSYRCLPMLLAAVSTPHKQQGAHKTLKTKCCTLQSGATAFFITGVGASSYQLTSISGTATQANDADK